MAETNLAKFKKLLSELFMLDQADLDFGIYRIMNAKREEITRFLNNDLLPQVKGELETLGIGDQAQLEQEYREALEQAKRFGVAGPENAPPVVEARMKMEASVDVATMESEVFSHLFNFFRRYYSEGDFLSLRRYKEGVYAIPYEGEEVKLYWANADQYYIKTSENFRDYIFKLSDGRRIHFKLVAADTEQNNNKAAEGQDRRFILSEREPLVEENGELLIRFEYRTDAEKRKQADLNAETVRQVLSNERFGNWSEALHAKAPTEKNPSRTLLEKHLTDYTSRNTFDYFIHKDLGGFLRRELDFYIKNEVMHLDDIESEATPRVEQYLYKVKAIRRIAHKVIAFLEQLENFEKKLWLKKKFVVETNYCVTLDRVPEDLYIEVVANVTQVEEWGRLFAINEITDNPLMLKDFPPPLASCVPLTIEFLKANPFLILDTKFFGQGFKNRLLASFENLDEQTDGLLIHSENFQALNLLQQRYREQVKCIYIDPPYNTASSEILYKNNYKKSSWLTMMDQCIGQARDLLASAGVLCATIDDQQQKELSVLLADRFGDDNILGTISIRINPSGRVTLRGVAQAHEYAIFLGKTNESSIAKLPRTEEQQERFNQSDERGVFEWRNFRREGSSSERHSRPKRYFPLYVKGQTIRIPKMEWIEKDKAYRIMGLPEGKEKTIYPIDSNGNERVWRWGIDRILEEIYEIVPKERNGELQIYYKYRPNSEGVLPLTVWMDKKYSATEYGTAVLKKIFGDRNLFNFPKSIYATMDCIRIGGAADLTSLILDYFGGSGTTGHAVINLNREDQGCRKYLLAEMGEHFDTVLVPRLKKVIYSKDWQDGTPVSREGSSHLFKYIRLESYEDALNNIELKRTAEQASLLEAHDEFREDYMLRYMLNVEASGSASLLNIENFADPFNYQLNIATGRSVGETRPVTVDLIETFNYLLGLRVKHVDTICGFRIIEGTSLEDEKVLIIWRNTLEKTNEDLDQFFQKQGYNTRDRKFDLIYTNGDNNLENLKRADETWKVRLIEEEFQRLMFDVQDV